jgi:NAD(P)-dependent dehydrogenase (short-subunit alcohol dehydrogenase family)
MTAPMSLLAEKVAVITGGARGIGFAIAQAMVKEGACVAIVDSGCSRDGEGKDPEVARAAAADLVTLGGKALGICEDVSEPGAALRVFAQVAAEFGEADILVNCAGILRDGPLMSLEAADFDAVVQVHLRGTFLFTQAFAQQLRGKRKGGAIVNMTSVSGLLGNGGQSSESSGKAGIYGLTRTAAIELQKYGIVVNAIAAVAKTRLTSDLPMFEKVDGTMEPEHVAPVAVYLCSALSEGLSGAVLSVAGGRIASVSLKESGGRTKREQGGLWTPHEIAENFAGISR